MSDDLGKVIFTGVVGVIAAVVAHWLWSDRFLTIKLWIAYASGWPICVGVILACFIFVVGVQPRVKLARDELFQSALVILKRTDRSKSIGPDRLHTLLQETAEYRRQINELRKLDSQLPLEEWFRHFKIKLGGFLGSPPPDVIRDVEWIWKSPQLSLVYFDRDKRGVIFSWKLEGDLPENYSGVYVVDGVPITLHEFISSLGGAPWPEHVTKGIFEFLKMCGSDQPENPRITNGAGNDELYMRCCQGDVRQIDFGEAISSIPLRVHIEHSLRD